MMTIILPLKNDVISKIARDMDSVSNTPKYRQRKPHRRDDIFIEDHFHRIITNIRNLYNQMWN